MNELSKYIKHTTLQLNTSFEFLYLFLLRTLPGDQSTSVIDIRTHLQSDGRSYKYHQFKHFRNVFEGTDIVVFLVSKMNRYGQEKVTLNTFEISDEVKIRSDATEIWKYITNVLGISIDILQQTSDT